MTGYKTLPVQLYEAIFLFLLFAVCLVLYMKKDFKYNLPLYLVAYGIFRFLIEFVRDDNRGELIGAVTPSQFWSILMVVIGVALFFYLRYVYKNRPKIIEEPVQTKEEEEIEQ